jgi:hypothetical protein
MIALDGAVVGAAISVRLLGFLSPFYYGALSIDS